MTKSTTNAERSPKTDVGRRACYHENHTENGYGPTKKNFVDTWKIIVLYWKTSNIITMENFEQMFLNSIRDGSYSDGLHEKVNGLRDKRHLWSLKCIQDTKNWVDSTITKATIYPVVISDNGWTSDLKWAEMANTILKCEQLGQSRNQPSYYPPVLAYTHPHDISGKPTQIKTLKEQKEKGTFVDHNVTVTRSPMMVEEFESSMKSLIGIDSSLLSSLKIYEQVIRAKKIVTTPHFSSTEIIKQVGYLVNLQIDPIDWTTALTGIYVLHAPTTLKALIDFLAKLNVSNPDDLMEAQITLRELYFSITPKP